MAVPRFLARHLVLPLQELLRGRSTMRFLRWMRKNDRRTAEELSALHEHLLVEHLRRAARLVPFYRERVDASCIESSEDLQRFPILSKADVREAGGSLVADGFRDRVFTMETGGSTGEPLRFFTHNHREASQLAARMRSRLWWGVAPGMREAQLWGSPIEAARTGSVRTLAAWLQGFQLLSAFDLNEETMASYQERLARGRCDVLHGYPSALARFARFLRGRGEDLRTSGIRLVVCTAENLLDQDAADIRRVTEAPLANEYGCREGALIAHESPDGFHLMHDAVHLEVLSGELEHVQPGEIGEGVLTNLHARACPLIRYRLGDRVRLDPEPARGAIPHPRILEVAGRTTDSLVKDDGSRVHGLALIYILRELPGVERFRCIQDRLGEVRIELVPGSEFDASGAQAGIVDRVHRILGAATTVDLKILDELVPHESGKHRHVICRVPD